MGAIADAFAAFAQPLIDQTDGSYEQVSKAFAISQACYNLAIAPEEKRGGLLNGLQQAFKMTDEEFEAFQMSILVPMIQRHEEMFPRMHGRTSSIAMPSDPLPEAQPQRPKPGDPYPGTDRYAPCPCGSGEKYKFCCGKKGH